jgi:4-carboxymuconolactone decarboxylase
MSQIDFTSPREAARACTSQLAAFVEDPPYAHVWNDPALSKRDRSLVTLAALITLHAEHELPAYLRRARDNGVIDAELAVLITHPAFYAGFPAAITASAAAAATLASKSGADQ